MGLSDDPLDLSVKGHASLLLCQFCGFLQVLRCALIVPSLMTGDASPQVSCSGCGIEVDGAAEVGDGVGVFYQMVVYLASFQVSSSVLWIEPGSTGEVGDSGGIVGQFAMG